MTDQVKIFNPLEMSEELILAVATGREKLLDQMLHEMKVCLKKGSNQHFILYGPRGIGKSFFSRLLKIYHDRFGDFNESLYIQLPEEQENINFTADLLDVISTLLEGGQLIDAVPKWSISDAQWQNAVKRLRKAIDEKTKSGIKHIFVTQENLQIFIPKLDKIESSRMRVFLSDFDEITLIGSSLRPDLDNDYSKRLFQVFKKFDMEPWSADEFLGYYEKVAAKSHNETIKRQNIKISKNKVRAISQFTGGSPRLAVILGRLILDKNILETVQLLDGLIDELTSYYQDITNDIPTKSKILFDMLIRKGENMTQSALASAFYPQLEQNAIARSFSWLLDNYYVVFNKQNKGNTKYFYVRDRLYVLYYQKRQVYADIPFSFVGVFVDFLIQFFTIKERKEELQNLDTEHPYAHPLLYHMALKDGVMCSPEDHPVLLKESILSKFDSSTAILDGSKALNKQIDDYHSQAELLYNQKLYDQAIDALNNVLKLDPKYASAYHNLGIAMKEKGDLDGAILQYRKAIELNPKDASAYYNLGIAMSDKGDLNGAILQYQEAIKLDPKDASAYYNLGIAMSNKGDLNGAILQYQEAIKLDPKDAMAYYNLGIAMYKKGDLDGAILQYQKAIHLDPKDAWAYNNLGNAMFEKGDLEGAILQFQEAIKLDPKNARAYVNLGITYLMINDFEKAHENFQIALGIEDDSYDFPTMPLENIITQNEWQYLSQYVDVWERADSISDILAKALYKVVTNNPENKFMYFKKTIDALRQIPAINPIEVSNALCINLYKNREMDFLRQVVGELEQDYKENPFMTKTLQVYNYLIDSQSQDINQLHPDVRTVVNSILNEKH
jgi:Flp pilus assembly protein TadD